MSDFIIARDPQSPPAGLVGAVAAIGNFDGLHRGHRGVIARAQALAKKLGRPCVLLTFEPHPADVFAGRPVIFRLTPPDAKAAQAHQVDIVALSFSQSMNPNQVYDGLQELRQLLPETTQVWAGGRNPVLQRRPVQGVLVMGSMELIPGQVRDWRQHQLG